MLVETAVFWDMAPYRLVYSYRRLWEASCLWNMVNFLGSEDGDSKFPRNVGNYLPIYTESYPRILISSLQQHLTFRPKRRNKILRHISLLASLCYILRSGQTQSWGITVLSYIGLHVCTYKEKKNLFLCMPIKAYKGLEAA